MDFEACLYENLFFAEWESSEESEDQDFTALMNPNSLKVVNAKIEPGIRGAAPGAHYQFERVGYFCVDKDSTPERFVLNRTTQLRDTWAKIEKSQKANS